MWEGEQAKEGSLRRGGLLVGLVVAEGCESSGHRDAGDTAMTRVSVWGIGLNCVAHRSSWEALSAVSTEAVWRAGRAQRTAQAGSRLCLALWPSGHSTCACACACACARARTPCSVLMAGSGPTMHAKSSRRGGSGIAG